MRYKIGVCGAFNSKAPSGGGQVIKTRIFSNELEKQLGALYRIDTIGSINKIMLIPRLFYALVVCQNIVILPAQSALGVESRFLRYLNIFFHRGLHYVVIGGWLQNFLQSRSAILRALTHFDGIYVETNTMKKSLVEMGLTKVWYLPNFKDLTILREDQVRQDFKEPYELVMFARVTEKKGTGDAVNIINRINSEYGREVFTLDIYGPIDSSDIPWFENLKKSFSNCIHYKGVVDYNKTVEVLASYFALLFPTKYYTEGIPGTIIDSFAAGLPVISSKWKSFSDVVQDGFSGIGFDFGNVEAFYNTLVDVVNNPVLLNSMRKNCITAAYKFTPKEALEVLRKNLK